MVLKTLVINESFLNGELSGKQYQVAEALGIHPRTLYGKIRRTDKLTLEELNKIAVILGRDTHDFLSVVENEQESEPVETKEKETFEREMREGYLANYDFIKKSSKEWDFTLGDGL